MKAGSPSSFSPPDRRTSSATMYAASDPYVLQYFLKWTTISSCGNRITYTRSEHIDLGDNILGYNLTSQHYTKLCTRFVIIMLKSSEDLLSNNIVCLPVISLAAFVGNIMARRTGVVHLEPSYSGFGILAEHWLFYTVETCYTTLVPLTIILPTNAASEIMSRQTMLFDKRSSLIFNMMITNRMKSFV
ncbi:hypothetical protein SFRURICE_003058 [Spodoptera frugiperda]|nr:hypothetical protein SFRURICE_003058 [Spodoptera frugiperda]